jgi:predicted transcriptional regulator
LDDLPVLDGIAKMPSPRRSLLDLAPLELDCMNTLWPIGEATVREIREQLSSRRARAYTTIMTIMDRLARKGIVERKKAGRAYIYRPRLSAEEARTHALAQVLDNFFGGSKEALLAHLDGAAEGSASVVRAQMPPVSSTGARAGSPESADADSAAGQHLDGTVV